jgi:hypothetical protein
MNMLAVSYWHWGVLIAIFAIPAIIIFSMKRGKKRKRENRDAN